MNWPPYALVVRHYDAKRVRLWLPLFLFWPFLLVGALLCLMLAVILTVLSHLSGKGTRDVRKVLAVVAFFFALKGLVVEHSHGSKYSRIEFK